MIFCSWTDMLSLRFRSNCRFHNTLNHAHFISGIVSSWNKSCRVMIKIGLPLRKMQRFCDISKIYLFVVCSYSAQFPDVFPTEHSNIGVIIIFHIWTAYKLTSLHFPTPLHAEMWQTPCHDIHFSVPWLHITDIYQEWLTFLAIGLTFFEHDMLINCCWKEG